MPNVNTIINVINLDPFNGTPKDNIRLVREERAASIVRQSKQHGFNVRFWEGVKIEKQGTMTNIVQAFKKIVQFAKDHNYPFITIAEDDMVFTAPGAWEYYCNNTPEDFDTYLGGIYQAQLQEGRIMNGYSGHTLITVHQRFYDFFLSAYEKDHLDRWLGNVAFRFKFMVCEPFVVKQMGGYSENIRKPACYDEFHKAWKYYGL